jgi:hypothetical protein
VSVCVCIHGVGGDQRVVFIVVHTQQWQHVCSNTQKVAWCGPLLPRERIVTSCPSYVRCTSDDMDTGATPILVTVRRDYSCSWQWMTVVVCKLLVQCSEISKLHTSWRVSRFKYLVCDQPLKPRAPVDRGVWAGARDTVTVHAYGGTQIGAQAVGEQHKLRTSSAINNT